MRRVLVVVLGLACVFTSPALAEPPADTPEPSRERAQATVRVAESLRIAEAFWGEAPACKVQVFEATPDEMVAFTGVAAAGVTYIGPVDGVCPIWLSSIYAAASIENRIEACDVLVHELGHALGREHDDGPLSVMNQGAELTVWGCYERFIGRGGRAWRETHPGSRWAAKP